MGFEEAIKTSEDECQCDESKGFEESSFDRD